MWHFFIHKAPPFQSCALKLIRKFFNLWLVYFVTKKRRPVLKIENVPAGFLQNQVRNKCGVKTFCPEMKIFAIKRILA
jgi:hypothetical protein